MDFFRGQVPFAISRAVNSTAFDVRQDTVERVYPRDFEMRNRALPRKLFGVVKKATKRDPEAIVGQTLDRDWTEKQATGGVKKPRGGAIAISPTPDAIRTSSGAVRKNLKPRNLKGAFKVGTAIYVRDREGDPVKAYNLVRSARIPKRFMFYEEAMARATAVFSDHLWEGMDYAIRTSRFFPE